MRLDRALIADLGTALRSWPIIAFLTVELVAGVVFVARRGSDTISMVFLIWLGMAVLAFFAWWAGRHRLAHPAPDPVPAARARTVFALIGVAGMIVWSISMAAGIVLFISGLGGWLWAAWRNAGFRNVGSRLTRDVRPFVPLLLLIGIPRLVIGGPGFLVAFALALPSGIGQQLMYLLGLYAPMEAIRSRPAVSAVVAAWLFGLIHMPLLVEPNGGDLLAALANAVLFQASVGLIAVLGYQRHRAPVPIGMAHALAIA